jgi:ferredoxin-NADP reductase
VAFAGGSGITPVLSIVKTVLAVSSRRVRLLYANRDRDSVIFGPELERLADRYAGRLSVVYHYDLDWGYVGQQAIRAFAGGDDSGFFVCGPEPFMDCVQAALAGAGVDAARIRTERFTPVPDGPVAEETDSSPVSVEVRLGRQTVAGEHRPDSTILQTARALGLRPPSSCEAGSCATCMARVVEGSVEMRNNEALTPEEIAEGWALTCQAVPTSPSVRVVYE